MTLFLHEKHELLHLVVNSIRKDLLDHNELFNCLALHAIANVGGREMGEALSGEVHRLLISPYVPPCRGGERQLTRYTAHQKLSSRRKPRSPSSDYTARTPISSSRNGPSALFP